MLAHLEISGRNLPLKIAAPAKQGSLRHWKFSKVHTVFRLPYVYDCHTKLCRQQAEVIRNHESEHVRIIGQGEAIHK
jgi:hypothetical protein